MKVTEHLANSTGPLISFEIIPPKRGGDLNSLLSLIEDLAVHRPPFIDITSHPAEVVYDQTSDGPRRRVTRKRPGTLGICALIQNKLGIDAVPHVLCETFTREETEDFLIELHYLGIDNVFAVRGDTSEHQKSLDGGRTRNEYASDLVGQITAMNRARFLEDLDNASPTEFCIGAAGYPEKHVDAPTLPADVARVKEKVDAGAEYIVTQMFFDNRHSFTFVDECRTQGINLPGSRLSISAPTEKDIRDLHFGIDYGVDYIALSFVEKPGDILRLKDAIHSYAGSAASIPVLSLIHI